LVVDRRAVLTGMSATLAGGALLSPAGASSEAKPALPPSRRRLHRAAPLRSESCFSDDYQTARRRFLEAAAAVGAYVEHHRMPGFDGPDGQPLYMDAVRIGPADADVVVVSVCGTHGAEGFCGSAAQIDWLLNEAPRRTLPRNVATLLVHAVNPYGFAHLLRTNENAVNINRNSIDFSAPLPANPLFEEIFATFPTRMGYDEELVAEFDAAAAAAEKKHGAWVVSDALGRGQYTNPAGQEYGGTRSEWSSQTLFGILEKHCAGARHIAYLDWHTLINIGDGKLVYLCFNKTGDPLFERAATWWGREAVDRESVNRQWSAGTTQRRPTRHGILMWGVQRALAPQADVAGAVIEFCADPDKLLFNPDEGERGWVYSRWLRHTRDYTSPMGKFVAAYLRETASPTRRSFQDAALTAARESYGRAFLGAGRWAKEGVAAQPGELVYYSSFS
jgi:hypothetical protein